MQRSMIVPIVLWLAACGPKDVIPSAPAYPASPAPAAVAQVDDEATAFERARPVFEKYCAKCHTTKGAKATEKKLAHFNMDSYPFGGHHAPVIGRAIREVLGLAGKEAVMPMDSPGAVKGAELDAILAWSQVFDRAHPTPADDHDEHHHGDDHDQEGH